MNRTQIFRVLYYLHKEPSPLMLAQDAYVIAQQCRVQLDGLGAILTDWKRQEAEGVTEITKCIAEAEATIELLPELSSLFKEIQDEAYTIWMCATVDKSKLAKGTAPALWEKHVAGRDPLPPELEEAIAAFRSHVFAKIELHFPELLELMRNEEDQARIDVSSFTVHPSNLLNVVPVVCQQQQWHSTQVYWCSSCFPQTHVRACSPNFPKHLGYSLARVLCTPVSQIVVNSSFITEVLDDLNRGVEIEQRPTIQFSYRTNARTIRTCQWEMCSELINGSFTAVGIDITSELESFNESSSANTQRMLRQWLHSIRNASFEQQAAILLDELNELRAAMGHRKGLESRFNSLTEGLTMLMKTAERSVGLIDHALDTKGFIQLLSVHDFVTNLAVFPSGDDIKVKVPKSVKQTAFKVTCLLNDVKVEPDEVSGLFVKCDIINIQNLVAKLIVACASCTDQRIGVEVLVAIETVGSKALKFRVYVMDFCHGGLSSSIFEKWRERLGGMKCFDMRFKEMVEDRVPARYGVHRSHAASTELDLLQDQAVVDHRIIEELLPSILESRSRLHLSHGEGDFTVMTFKTGTTYKFRFNGSVNTPSSQLNTTPDLDEDITKIKGSVLIVDDSVVIRKIVGKYFDSIRLPYVSCEDGLEAATWLKRQLHSCAAIITDLEMPKMGGDALIALAMMLDPKLPCFVLSGNDITSVNLPRGARRAIVKPVSNSDLHSVLREVLSLQAAAILSGDIQNYCKDVAISLTDNV